VSAEGSDRRYHAQRASAPVLIPMAIAFCAGFASLCFRTISQITLNYRRGPLSRGAAGQIHGGDRLPWAPIDGVGQFRLAANNGLGKVHVLRLGQRRTRCMVRGSKTYRFKYSTGDPSMRWAGLARDALYLLRPDTYVALADGSGAPKGRSIATSEITASSLRRRHDEAENVWLREDDVIFPRNALDIVPKMASPQNSRYQ